MFARTLRLGKEAVFASLLAAMSFGFTGPATAAASCPTDHGAKAQAAALVAQLHDAVPSHNARLATRRALVRSLHTMRGADASTKAERTNLGRQISALAKTLHDANGLVERKAIIVSIHALQAQKKRGHLTHAQRVQLKADNDALQRVIVAKFDNQAEIKVITAQFRKIHDSFTCTA